MKLLNLFSLFLGMIILSAGMAMKTESDAKNAAKDSNLLLIVGLILFLYALVFWIVFPSENPPPEAL